MSIFAGVYAFAGDSGRSEILSDAAMAIVAALSRGPDCVQSYEAPGFFLAKLDVGAFGEAGLLATDLGLTAVAGEPLLDPAADGPQSRMRDLKRLAQELSESGPGVLRSCQGSFAICHYDRVTGEIFLGTDKVGVRPLYFYAGKGLLIFSTALRVLESIDLIPKRMDLQAVTEEATFGFPLNDRTPYQDIKILRSAEVLRNANGGYKCEVYFRWQDVPETQRSIEEILDEAYRRFLIAVGRRSSRDGTAISFLSGGLDSRCIVAALKGLGRKTRTFAFDLVETPDLTIAKAFAEHIGVRHEVRTGVPSMRPLEQMVYRPDEPGGSFASDSAYPQLIFSGDGGSVGLGCVYVNETILRLMRDGRTRSAAESFLNGLTLPYRIFQPKAFSRLGPLPIRGVVEELESINSKDPGKAFYFFLMTNDQRRHLHMAVYEDIDVRRVEYLLPFFDGAFLELIASVPTDWLIYHRFYHRWLERFPVETIEIPWQTYPGHEPCPIGGLDFGPTQWVLTRKKRLHATRSLLGACQEALLRSPFPSVVMRRSVVWAAYALQRLGFQSYNHILKTYIIFAKYYKRCGGHVEFPMEKDLSKTTSPLTVKSASS